MEQHGAWDLRRAILLGAACLLTYRQYKQPYGPIWLPPSYRMIEAIEGRAFAKQDASFGFLLESEADAVLAFRGTRTTGEWVSNAIATQIPYPFVTGWGQTHEGITEIYRSLRERVVAALQSIPAGKPLYLTGHSLGGALATLAAPDLASVRGASPIVYTFGAPRVGNPKFVWKYDRNVPESYRICNKYDLATHLPPPVYKSPRTNTFYFYWHVDSRRRYPFRLGSLSANHALSSYFRAIARLNPGYASSVAGPAADWDD